MLGRIGGEVTGLEIVGAIDDDIVAGEQRLRIGGVESYTMLDHRDMRVDAGNELGCAIGLGPADIGRGVDDLSLQVGQRHGIVIDDAEGANTGGGKILQHGGHRVRRRR